MNTSYNINYNYLGGTSVISATSNGSVIKNKISVNKHYNINTNPSGCYSIDRKIKKEMPGVFFENMDSSYKVIENFIKDKRKKIGFLAGPQSINTARERLEGYKKALSDYNIEYDERLVLYGDFTLESGYRLGKRILKSRIDAIYISNNSMTLGFLKALKELNIDSKMLKIATFEDNEIIKFIDDDIISYDIPFNKLSKMSIEILENLLENKSPDNRIVEIKL